MCAIAWPGTCLYGLRTNIAQISGHVQPINDYHQLTRHRIDGTCDLLISLVSLLLSTPFSIRIFSSRSIYYFYENSLPLNIKIIYLCFIYDIQYLSIVFPNDHNLNWQNFDNDCWQNGWGSVVNILRPIQLIYYCFVSIKISSLWSASGSPSRPMRGFVDIHRRVMLHMDLSIIAIIMTFTFFQASKMFTNLNILYKRTHIGVETTFRQKNIFLNIYFKTFSMK